MAYFYLLTFTTPLTPYPGITSNMFSVGGASSLAWVTALYYSIFRPPIWRIVFGSPNIIYGSSVPGACH